MMPSFQSNLERIQTLLACPEDHAPLERRERGDELVCKNCHAQFPIWRDIPFVCLDHSLSEVTEGAERNVSVHGTNAADEFAVYNEDRVMGDVDRSGIERWLRHFLGDFPRHLQGKRVLDLGAGRCDYSLVVAELCADAQVVALDLLPTRMAHMNDRSPPPNL